eukprot:scaffold8464_cov116-Isochrysis_galbana.AAC.1
MCDGWPGRDMRAVRLCWCGGCVAAVVFDTSTPMLSSSEPSPSSNGRALSGRESERATEGGGSGIRVRLDWARLPAELFSPPARRKTPRARGGVTMAPRQLRLEPTEVVSAADKGAKRVVRVDSTEESSTQPQTSGQPRWGTRAHSLQHGDSHLFIGSCDNVSRRLRVLHSGDPLVCIGRGQEFCVGVGLCAAVPGWSVGPYVCHTHPT